MSTQRTVSPLAALVSGGLPDPLSPSSSPLAVSGGKGDRLPTAPVKVGALESASSQPRTIGTALDPALHGMVQRAQASTPVGPGVRIEPAGDEGFAPSAGSMSPLQSALNGLPGQIDQYNAETQAGLARQQQLQQQYLDGMKPVRDNTLGRFAAGLLQPTSTGSWAEGFGNAASAAMDARDTYDKEKAASEERRLNAQLALERIKGQQVVDPMEKARQQYDVFKMNRDVTGMTADDGLLANGLTPTDDVALIADYQKNPRKYVGTRGQQMVADAVERQRASASKQSDNAFELQKIEAQGRNTLAAKQLEIDANAGKPTPLDRAEATRVQKRIADATSEAYDAAALKNDIQNLRQARGKIGYEGTPWGLGSAYANTLGWAFEDAAAGQEVNSNATNLKVNMSTKLKGALSDKEGAMLESATPGLGMADTAANDIMNAYEAAAQRKIEHSRFLQAWVKLNGSDYGSDEAWDQYINDNPVVSSKKGGGLSIDQTRLGNWKSYVTGPDGQTQSGAQQPPQTSGGQGVQPMFDVNSLPPKVQAQVENLLRQGVSPEAIITKINDQILQQQKGAQ